jgi:hypothetical protein
MRVVGILCATAVVACLSPITVSAEASAQHRAAAVAAAEEQSEPYHKHRDMRHGHDHFYPDRGAIVRDLPQGTIGTSYAGVSYRYHDGIWLEPRGPAYMVVAPPIGLVAPTLPLYSTVVSHGTETFLYVNDTYYRPRPDLGGYEVVNDPTLEPPPAPEALVGGQMPGAPAPSAPTGGSATITPSLALAPVAGVGVAAASVPAAQTATASIAPPSVATQVASFPPPASASINGPASASLNASAVAPASAATAGAVPVVLPAAAGTPGTQKGPKVFLYPKNGQSADQQARDRYDCYRFAVAQSGFDPMRSAGSAPAAPASEQQSDYDRAQSACFEAHGYTNR